MSPRPIHPAAPPGVLSPVRGTSDETATPSPTRRTARRKAKDSERCVRGPGLLERARPCWSEPDLPALRRAGRDRPVGSSGATCCDKAWIEPSYTGLTMCMGPDNPRSEDDRRAISDGLRRYWKSDDGQAARFARKHAARRARLAKQHDTIAASEAASKH